MAPKATKESGAAMLNWRQRQVLVLVRKGLRNSEVASIMQVSEGSVKAYISQLFDVFEVTNRTELAVFSEMPGVPLKVTTPA